MTYMHFVGVSAVTSLPGIGTERENKIRLYNLSSRNGCLVLLLVFLPCIQATALQLRMIEQQIDLSTVAS
jgi:hypothetical protein